MAQALSTVLMQVAEASVSVVLLAGGVGKRMGVRCLALCTVAANIVC